MLLKKLLLCGIYLRKQKIDIDIYVIGFKMLRRHIYAITFIILLGITIRFYWIANGTMAHQISWDTFFYSVETNVLLKYHKMTWLLHPLSLWGLYPYSDSPAAPVLVAELSDISGISVEHCVFMFDILLIFLASISMYLLSFKINRSFVFPFIVTIIFVLAPISTAWTIWFIDERSFLVYYIPLIALIVLLFISSINKKENTGSRNYSFKLLVVLSVYAFIASTIHLIFIFSYGLFIAIIFLYSIKKSSTLNKLIKYISLKNYSNILLLGILIVSLYSLFILNEFVDLPYGFSLKQYKSTVIFTGEDPITILINIAISLTGGVGILFILFPFGLLYIIFKNKRSMYDNIILIVFISTLPIIINRLYSRPMMIFLCSIYIGFGFLLLIKIIKKPSAFKKFKKIIISMVIILSISSTAVFTEWYIYHLQEDNFKFNYPIENLYNYSTSPYTYEFALYQKHKFKGIWVCNDGFIAQRIQAYSNQPMMPVPLGVLINSNPALYNIVKQSDLKIRKTSKTEFKYTTMPYISVYLFEMHRDYYNLFKQDQENVINKYNIKYVCEYKKIEAQVAGYHSKNFYDSPFLKRLNESNIIVYENKYIRYYII